MSSKLVVFVLNCFYGSLAQRLDRTSRALRDSASHTGHVQADDDLTSAEWATI